ncbi:eukaryotic translation initiation factor 3 subunit F-like isoform X4 [Carex rostrata]
MAMAAVKSSKQTVLQRAGTGPSMSARIHPVVLFNICDSYVYRLLGSTSPDGTVEIKNSYVVPHNESADQVALDIDYHHNMFASHQKVNPKEALLDGTTQKSNNFPFFNFTKFSQIARQVTDEGGI